MTTQPQKNTKLSDLPKDHPLFQAAPTENAKRIVVTKPGLSDVGADSDGKSAANKSAGQKTAVTRDKTGSSPSTSGEKDATSTSKDIGGEKPDAGSNVGSGSTSKAPSSGKDGGKASGGKPARKRSRSAQNSAFQSMIQHMRYSHHSFVSQFDTVCAKYGKGGKSTPGSPGTSPATQKRKQRGSAVSAPVTFISDETGLPRHKRAKLASSRSAIPPGLREGAHSTSPYMVSPPAHPAMSPYDLHMHRGGEASTSPWVPHVHGSMSQMPPPPPSSTPHRPGTQSVESVPGQQHSPYIRNQYDQYHHVQVYGQPGYGPMNQPMPSPVRSHSSAPPVLHHASNSTGAVPTWNAAPGTGHPSPYTTSTQGHPMSTDTNVSGFNSAVAPPTAGYASQGSHVPTSGYAAGGAGTTSALGPAQQVSRSSYLGYNAYTSQQGSGYGHYPVGSASSQIEQHQQPAQGQHSAFQSGPAQQNQQSNHNHQQYSMQGGQVSYSANPAMTGSAAAGYVPPHGNHGYSAPPAYAASGGYGTQGSYPAPQPLGGASSNNS